jgi:hypothetical protein
VHDLRDVCFGIPCTLAFQFRDLNIEGTVPIEELCPLQNLREFDLDGGKLEGPVPDGFENCFPELKEIDLVTNPLLYTAINLLCSLMVSLSCILLLRLTSPTFSRLQ